MAGPEKVGVDSSAAFKWFVEEEDSDAAMRMAEDYADGRIDIASVELLPFEVLNALRYAPDTGLSDLSTAVHILDKLELDLHELGGELAERSVENALRYGITVYDSAYLSLGEIDGMKVYTADRKLISKAGGSVLKHIAEYRRADPA